MNDSEAFWFKETLMVFDRFAFLQDFGMFKMSMSQMNGFKLSQLFHQEVMFLFCLVWEVNLSSCRGDSFL